MRFSIFINGDHALDVDTDDKDTTFEGNGKHLGPALTGLDKVEETLSDTGHHFEARDFISDTLWRSGGVNFVPCKAEGWEDYREVTIRVSPVDRSCGKCGDDNCKAEKHCHECCDAIDDDDNCTKVWIYHGVVVDYNPNDSHKAGRRVGYLCSSCLEEDDD